MDRLRARYLEVFTLLERVPNPRVASPATLFWSVIAAGGASFVAWATVTMIFAVVLRGFGAYPAAWADGVAMIFWVGAGLGVAFVAGGADALAIYAAILVLVRLMAAGSSFRFCLGIVSNAPPTCSFLGYVASLWPYVLGTGLGYVFVRWFWRRPGFGNSLLETIGALALTETLLRNLDAFLFPSASSLESGLLRLGTVILAGLACGLVLLSRVEEPRQWPTLGIVGLFIVGPWFMTELPAFMEQVGIAGRIVIGPLQFLAFLRPFVELLAAAVVLYIAAAQRVSAEISRG